MDVLLKNLGTGPRLRLRPGGPEGWESGEGGPGFEEDDEVEPGGR